MPRLIEHELSGAIGMLKAGVRVSGAARYYNCHPSTIQHLRDCYQATKAVKGRHRPGQLRMATDIKTATYVDYICIRFLIKKYFITITLNPAQFLDKFQIAALESKAIIF